MTELKEFSCLDNHLLKSEFRSKEARKIVSRFLSEVTGIDYNILVNANYIAGEIPKQRNKTKYISKKATAYTFAIITESIRTKDRYPNIELINIDNFNMYNTDKDIITFICRDEEGHIENDLYKSYHVTLDNCDNSLYNEVKKFTKFLKMTTIKDMRKYFEGDEDYMDAIDKNEAHDMGYKEGLSDGISQGIKKAKLELAKKLKEIWI